MKMITWNIYLGIDRRIILQLISKNRTGLDKLTQAITPMLFPHPCHHI
jgi:hypothetical protein